MDYEKDLAQFLEFDPDIEGTENAHKFESAKIEGDLISLWETLSLYGVHIPSKLGPNSTIDDARLAINAFSKLYQMVLKETNARQVLVWNSNDLESKR